MNDLDRLLIERACERLVVDYARLIDFGRAADVAALFIDDAVLELSAGRMEGHGAIAEFFTKRQAATNVVSRHICTNVAIDVVDATHATGLVYLSFYRLEHDHDGPAPLRLPNFLGQYSDEYILSEAGWKFASRIGGVASLPDMDESDKAAAALVVGAVDLYVHAMPDLIPRAGDDFALARTLANAGVRSAIHRHHFSATAERSWLVRQSSGFPLLGAILCNDTVGGLNPSAVQLAVETGAAWIGLPTIGSKAQRERFGDFGRFSHALTFGPGDLSLCGDDGRTLPALGEIFELARADDVTVNLGYASFAECVAAVEEAAAMRVPKLVITNPLTTMRFSVEMLDDLLERHGGLFVEQTCYSLHPTGSYGGSEIGIDAAAAMIRHVSPHRVVLSSDGGVVGAPPPPELLAWGTSQLLDRGLSVDHLAAMVRDNPSLLATRSMIR